jgi:hypothetical protein
VSINAAQLYEGTAFRRLSAGIGVYGMSAESGSKEKVR